MKKMIVAMIAMVSLSAAAKTVTVTVCDGGESGQECRTVTYEVRPSTGLPPSADDQCGGDINPCAPAHYGIPGWLKDLNDMFPGGGSNYDSQVDQYQKAGG